MPDSRHAVLAVSLQDSSQQRALWLADMKRERMRKLTATTSIEDSPSIAPDGKRLVFTSLSEDYDLLEFPLDGSTPRMLLANSRNSYSPSWSPSGDQIIYSTDRAGRREIWIHNVKAGIDRPVVTPEDFPPGTTQGLVQPVFSPDGNRFAFVRYAAGQPATVWIAPTVGGAPIRLTSELMMSPAWSPDGTSIAGLMQKDHPWQPAVVGVGADMSPHVIPGAPTCLTPLDWSPAGDWIACESREGVALFARDGSRSRLLPRLNASLLAFARDGSRSRLLPKVERFAARLRARWPDPLCRGAREPAEFREGGRCAYRSRPHGGAICERVRDRRRAEIPSPPEPGAGRESPDRLGRQFPGRSLAAGGVPCAAALVALLAVTSRPSSASVLCEW
jgi:hypothetical protein